MQILFLSAPQTILLDILVWVLFHVSIGFWSSTISIDRFDANSWLFSTSRWEQDGEFYNRIFKVKKWKKYIPSGAALYKGAYEVKTLKSFDIESLNLWVQESCRSEFCHFIMIFPGFLFFLWNPADVGWWMVFYAFLNNLIPIVMQRYNRPRVKNFIKILESRAERTDPEPSEPKCPH